MQISDQVPTSHPNSRNFRQIRIRVLELSRYIDTLKIDIGDFAYHGNQEVADFLREELGAAEGALAALKGELMV